jgi:outer membrane lipoprotein-sorting protein
MRWMTLVAMILVAAPAYGQENDAEKLFRAMEKKIRSAKTIIVIVEGQINEKDKKGTIKGDFRAAEGDKAKMLLEVEGLDMGKPLKMTLISDGKKVYLIVGDMGGVRELMCDKVVEQGVGMFARAGIAAAIPAGADQDPKSAFDLDKAVPVKDFKLGAKEKVGKKDTQVVEYHLMVLGESLKASVWIDTATQLPVKREIVSLARRESRVSEAYSTFTLDSKFEAKEFELPK